MKKIIIISPHFPPVNAADLHRVRQALPYFREFGWEPVVFCVVPSGVELARDDLLLSTIPSDIEIHRIDSFDPQITRLFGLGNLGIRCWLQLRAAVDQYLDVNHVDLILFSTTVFVTISLGPHWKKKYGIPFAVDLQDPWRNDFYLNKPRALRPRKFWFDYRVNKILERQTMPKASGVISVSASYPADLKKRYPSMARIPTVVLPFGALPADIEVANSALAENRFFAPGESYINLVYVGAVPENMNLSLSALFLSLRRGLAENLDLFQRVKLFFIGTSYAVGSSAVKFVKPLAERYGIEHLVVEVSAREPYFNALRLMIDADLVLLLGTTDSGYTASKTYPCIQSKKPVFAIFSEESSVVDIVRRTKCGEVVTFADGDSDVSLSRRVYPILRSVLRRLPFVPETDWKEFEQYSARTMTKNMCKFLSGLNSRMVDS